MGIVGEVSDDREITCAEVSAMRLGSIVIVGVK